MNQETLKLMKEGFETNRNLFTPEIEVNSFVEFMGLIEEALDTPYRHLDNYQKRLLASWDNLKLKALVETDNRRHGNSNHNWLTGSKPLPGLFRDIATNQSLLLLNDFEIQLILLALSWAKEKSRLEERAQTKPLTELESKIRTLYHQKNNVTDI